ncbi:hypothetical protein, partial [Streptomyces sp. P9(2023)]|uniref:hypothetical protein n=1 Tax=Streptomyces sp. P9(2023) TaxID=3064394 RepID=UPI0028F3E869
MTNALAGMMLSTLVSTMAGKGGVLGSIIGAVLAFVLMNGITSVFNRLGTENRSDQFSAHVPVLNT